MKGTIKRALAGIAAAAVAMAGLAAGAATSYAANGDITLYDTIELTADNAQVIGTRNYEYVKLADLAAMNNDATADPSSKSYLTVNTVRTPESVTNAIVQSMPSEWDAESDPMMWVAQNLTDSDTEPYMGNLRNFVNNLQSNLDSQHVTWTEVRQGADGAKLTIRLDQQTEGPGIYLIREKSQNADTDKTTTPTIPILVSTKVEAKNDAVIPTKHINGTVALKDQLIQVEKTVDENSPSVGDIRTYTITAPVPNWTNTNLETAHFKFIDTPERGQTVDFTSIRVGVKDGDEHIVDPTSLNVGELQKPIVAEVPVAEDKWDATYDPFSDDDEEFSDGNSITIDLTNRMKEWAIDSQYIGKTVEVTYTVTINTDAVYNADDPSGEGAREMVNEIKVDSDGTVSTDQTTINETAVLMIRKTQADESAMLSGAELKKKKKGESNPLMFTKLADGVYVYNPGGKDNTESTLVTADMNYQPFNLMVGGLGKGEYVVTETNAPEGYWGHHDGTGEAVLSFDVQIDGRGVVTWTSNMTGDPFDLVPEMEGPGTTTYGSSSVTVITVKNINSITQLPLTGAAGITMFVVLGLLIAGVGVTVYVKSRGVRNALRG